MKRTSCGKPISWSQCNGRSGRDSGPSEATPVGALPPNGDVPACHWQCPLHVDSRHRLKGLKAQVLLKKSVIHCRWGDVVIQCILLILQEKRR